ncbi:MAG: Maf family protein [Armatimonadota bacterium]
MPPFDIILASASPRRRELLSLMFEDFRVLTSNFDESEVPSDLLPAEHVIFSATEKARDVAKDHPNSLIIGADTIVVVDEQILGKPKDEQDAARMLRLLSGRTHEVYTGIAAILNDIERRDVECTEVRFRDLSEEMISRYIATGEPQDKAGAYAIQGKGATLIKGISGCYPNVVGLPLYKLSVLLSEFWKG